MSDVKWIKITTDIFDDEKIAIIETMPDADSIIVIWFKLLCLAGKTNNSGVFMMNEKIAYTDKMLATIFRRKESTVQLALKTFEEFGMIEIIDGVITIPKWGKHQNLDLIEKKREYQREYMSKYREKQRLLASKTNSKDNCKTNSKANVSRVEEDIEEEREEDIDINIYSPKKADYTKILNLFHEHAKTLPRVRTLNEARKAKIRNLLKEYSADDFETVFRKAEASDFLSGRSGKWTACSFDWLIKPSNFLKVIEGNYDNKESRQVDALVAWATGDDYGQDTDSEAINVDSSILPETG